MVPYANKPYWFKYMTILYLNRKQHSSNNTFNFKHDVEEYYSNKPHSKNSCPDCGLTLITDPELNIKMCSDTECGYTQYEEDLDVEH